MLPTFIVFIFTHLKPSHKHLYFSLNDMGDSPLSVLREGAVVKWTTFDGRGGPFSRIIALIVQRDRLIRPDLFEGRYRVKSRDKSHLSLICACDGKRTNVEDRKCKFALTARISPQDAMVAIIMKCTLEHTCAEDVTSRRNRNTKTSTLMETDSKITQLYAAEGRRSASDVHSVSINTFHSIRWLYVIRLYIVT